MGFDLQKIRIKHTLAIAIFVGQIIKKHIRKIKKSSCYFMVVFRHAMKGLANTAKIYLLLQYNCILYYTYFASHQLRILKLFVNGLIILCNCWPQRLRTEDFVWFVIFSDRKQLMASNGVTLTHRTPFCERYSLICVGLPSEALNWTVAKWPLSNAWFCFADFRHNFFFIILFISLL